MKWQSDYYYYQKIVNSHKIIFESDVEEEIKELRKKDIDLLVKEEFENKKKILTELKKKEYLTIKEPLSFKYECSYKVIEDVNTQEKKENENKQKLFQEKENVARVERMKQYELDKKKKLLI